MTIAKWKEDTPTDPRKYMSTTCVTHEHETPAHKAHRGLRTRSQGELRASGAYRRAGAGAGGIAEAGKPDSHRHAGGSHPAHRHRLGALRIYAAAPFPPAGVDGTRGRRGPGSVRPVRSRRPQRTLVWGCPARAAGRRPQNLPIRLP